MISQSYTQKQTATFFSGSLFCLVLTVLANV